MDDLLALASLVLMAVVLSSLLTLLILLSLSKETKSFQVLIQAHTARCELDHVLPITLADLLSLLGVQHYQLLLLNPLSIDLSLLGWGLLFVGCSYLDSLALVVFLKGQRLWLFWLLLSWGLFSRGLLVSRLFGLSGILFRSFLDVLVLVQLILDVANIAPSASLLARPITE